ncbi:RNA polymerase I subunit F [Xylocopa sonorina]|uniref:RNA polymerase I subunit F n=1 Tax=Xylocopa sonorina TaxID=1818115 RepID=UPI00403A9489
MRFKAYTGITWSDLELMGLLEDEDSRVYYEKYKKHVGLHPFHLTNLNAALNEILSSNLNSYDPDLKGFLLAYKNPKLLTPLGEIFYDTCFIHVDIEADFYIFRPEVGCTLKGVVNKKGLDHIGILVHKAFNVSIPKKDDEEDWVGDDLEIGQEVRFEITILDVASKLPFIRGSLNPDDYLRGCKLVQKNVNNRRLPSDNNIENSTENSVNRNSKKNSANVKKKKHTFFATDSEVTSDEDVPQVKEEIVRHKKSRKKSEQEEVIKSPEKKKKERKCDKNIKEIDESEFKVAPSEYANNSSINGEVADYEELAKPIDVKIKVKKKPKISSSQSSIEEDNNDEKPIKHQVDKKLKKLSNLDSKADVKKFKFELHLSSSDVEQITEESVFESKPKIKRSPVKRKAQHDSDTSANEFTTEKYIKTPKSPSKKDLKKIKKEELMQVCKTEPVSDVEPEFDFSNVNVKIEEFRDS